MEPGLRITGPKVSDFGRVGSRVSVSDPLFDPVLSFNMRVYRVALFLQSNTISTNQYLHNFMPSTLKAQILTIY